MKDVLNIAYATEMSGLKFYENLSAMDKEFNLVCTLKSRACEILEQKAKSLDIKLDTNSQIPLNVYSNFQDNLIAAIAYENSLCAMYASLCESCDDDELRDIFFRLWATSENEYKPALKMLLFAQEQGEIKGEIKSDENPLTNFQSELESFNEKVNKIINKQASQDDIKQLLNTPNFAFYGGLSLGALAASIIAKNMERKDEQF